MAALKYRRNTGKARIKGEWTESCNLRSRGLSQFCIYLKEKKNKFLTASILEYKDILRTFVYCHL